MTSIHITGSFATRLKPICAFLLVCFFLTFNASAQFSRSDESVATSLYPIMLNTSWENQASFSTFQIGVLDSDTSFYSVLRKKYDGISFKGKKVSVVHFKNADAISPTQVLCVDKKFNKKIEKVVKAISGNNTLLVTNSCKDDDYIMVNFNGRLKKDDFTVNQENMTKAGLKLTNQFEQYMEGTVAWEALLNESTEKLEKEREKVAAKEETIKDQKAKINYQKMTLKEKMEMLDEQGSILEEQAQKLDSQAQAISDQEDILFEQKRNIEAQKGQINEYLQKLGMQRVILIMALVVLILILGIAYILY